MNAIPLGINIAFSNTVNTSLFHPGFLIGSFFIAWLFCVDFTFFAFYRFFAIEFVTFTICFVPFTVGFVTFAVEFVSFAIEFVAFALEYVAFAQEFIIITLTAITSCSSQGGSFLPWRIPVETLYRVTGAGYIRSQISHLN